MKEKEPIISKSTLGNRQERVVRGGAVVVHASHDSSWREQCQGKALLCHYPTLYLNCFL